MDPPKKRGRKPKEKKEIDEVPKEKKKRGRKPKEKTEEELNKIVIKKKRGRKKKCSSETLQELFIHRNSEENKKKSCMKFNDNNESEHDNDINDDINKEEISFGGLNITYQKNEECDVEEIRNKLKINAKSCNIQINEDLSSEESEIDDVKEYNDKLNSYFMTKDKYKMKSLELPSEQKIDVKRIIPTLKKYKEYGKENIWPKTTDIYCWWCCHQFSSPPKTLPIKYDSHRNRYKTLGIFCSWECVKSYNNDRRDAQTGIRNMYLTRMIKDIYGSINTIIPAPPRESLKIFGGPLTIDEFRKSFKVKLIKLIKEPFIPINQDMEEITFNKLKRLPPQKKTLRLQRRKDTVNHDNKIIDTL